MSNSIKHALVAVVLVIVAIITSYYFVRGNDIQYIQDSNKLINTKNKVLSADKNPAKTLRDTFSQQPSIEKNEFKPPPFKGQYYIKRCGNSLDDKNTDIYKYLQMDGLSTARINARNKIIDICNKWYDFSRSLSESEVVDYKKSIKTAKELDEYFNNAQKKNRKETLNTTRSIIASGVDSSKFTAGALRYLLKKDHRFLNEIAKELNIKSTLYIKQNAGNLISLYMCTANYHDECSVNSLVMLQSCLDYDSMCGLSFDQVISSWVTPNNYADLLVMVDIIRKLVREGFLAEDY